MTEQAFDLKSALKYAIHAEIQANEFYAAWAKSSEKKHVRDELTKLAEWEASHKDALTNYYEQLFGEKFARDPNFMVDPALNVQVDEFKDFYSLLRIASAAYLSEMRAAELYAKLAWKVDGDGRKMFADLESMEKSHMQDALKRYNDLREEVEVPLMF